MCYFCLTTQLRRRPQALAAVTADRNPAGPTGTAAAATGTPGRGGLDHHPWLTIYPFHRENFQPKDMNPHQNFSPNKDAAAFTLREASVMARLGLHNKDDIRSIRTEFLVEDTDWALVAGRVMWSETGLDKAAAGIATVPLMAAAAGLFNAPDHFADVGKKAPHELNAEAWMMDNAEVVRVVKSDLPNRRILICLTDSGKRVTVLGVRDNRMFLANSLTGRIYAFPDEGGTAAWLYAGPIVRGPSLNPPSPKTRGRW